MNKIRIFQRVMMVLLTGVNAFVFMSMKGIPMKYTMVYTLLSIGIVSVLIYIFTRLFHLSQKKSSTTDQKIELNR
jgi:hypothetical protein